MMNSSIDRKSKENNNEEDDQDDVVLPGFRFHPTDEELVGFYLRRKVEKKSIRLELIKQIDIYKYDPWDLPRHSGMGGNYNEGYFFCKRGRKYRNSIRPNRVTGSGFWKATGIDKPIYSNNKTSSSSSLEVCQDRRDDDEVCIIGLKKTLVYYRGTAGKGTKTDWMMHEFRLPPTTDINNNNNMINVPNTKTTNLQEAEVWTLCRILKRNVSYTKKYRPEWREDGSKRQKSETKSYSVESSSHESYINFGGSVLVNQYDDQKPNIIDNIFTTTTQTPTKQQFHQQYWNTNIHQQYPSIVTSSNITVQDTNNNNNNNIDPFVCGSNSWDDLRSVMEFAFHDPSLL
ncbi:hypothetical protein ACFE04_025073 [Oxalis oulophora]